MQSSQMLPALQAQGLSVAWGRGRERICVLDRVSLTLHAGRWTCLVGPNGAGKSTLLRALAGVHACSAGQVWLHGRSLAGMGLRERARALAWLAQGAGDTGVDELSVYDVALLGRLPHQGWLSGPSAQDHAAVAQALCQVQAWDWRGRTLGELSGGERQRVLLARLLAVQAPVMLMDEPLLNLAPPHQADWIELVRGLVTQGKTVVSVLHEMTLALMADDVVVLKNGRIVHVGATGDTATHRAIEGVFENRMAITELRRGCWVSVPR